MFTTYARDAAVGGLGVVTSGGTSAKAKEMLANNVNEENTLEAQMKSAVGEGVWTADVVPVRANIAKQLEVFSFLDTPNAALTQNCFGVIDEVNNKITVHVPAATVVTALIATFKTAAASVYVGVVAQVSGTTPNDFTNPVVYKVNSTAGSYQEYTVTVVVG